MVIGDIVAIIGGLSVLFGACDVLDYCIENKRELNWKKTVLKILSGILVSGLGLLMKHFNV